MKVRRGITVVAPQCVRLSLRVAHAVPLLPRRVLPVSGEASLLASASVLAAFGNPSRTSVISLAAAVTTCSWGAATGTQVGETRRTSTTRKAVLRERLRARGVAAGRMPTSRCNDYYHAG